MSKEQQIGSLVSGLSAAEARKELHLAYRHMERCRRALLGEDVEPVGMLDTEDSIAEELFWQCVRCAEEMDYVDDEPDVFLVIPAEIEFYSTCDLLIDNYG